MCVNKPSCLYELKRVALYDSFDFVAKLADISDAILARRLCLSGMLCDTK